MELGDLLKCSKRPSSGHQLATAVRLRPPGSRPLVSQVGANSPCSLCPVNKLNSQRVKKLNILTFIFLFKKRNTTVHLLHSRFSILLTEDDLNWFVKSSGNSLHSNSTEKHVKLTKPSLLVCPLFHQPPTLVWSN